MDENILEEIQEIKEKTTRNIIFLSLRNLGIQVVSALGFFILTILLGTREVGLFAVVAESIGILGYFSDVGLASALIQQKEEVKKDELQTTFIIQQSLVLFALVLVAIIYPKLSLVKGYGSKELWIVISLCFSFAAASLKTIPSVLLERKLNFKLISAIDVIENISFYLIAVIFAFFGFGIYSYAIAIFFRSLLGLLIIYKFSPWPFGFSFSLKAAKKLFKFGIPFQINSFIAVAKDRLSNLLVAGIVGTANFGILSWAQKGPRASLGLMDAVMRVTFPTFSRLQDHKDALKRSLEKSTFFIAFFVFPVIAGFASVASNFIDLIPKYTKWEPALVPLYFYSVSIAIAAVTTPLTNAFNAVGKIRITTKLMIMWTVLTWIFYPILSIKFGYIGTSVAALIVGLSSFVVWYLVYKEFEFNVLNSIFKSFIGTVLMVSVLMAIQNLSLPELNIFILKIIIGILIYSGYHLIFSKLEINWFLQQIKCLRNKK